MAAQKKVGICKAFAGKRVNFSGEKYSPTFSMILNDATGKEKGDYEIGLVVKNAISKIKSQLQGNTPVVIENAEAAQPAAIQPCPCCKKGIMQHLLDFDHRGPPLHFIHQLFKQKTMTTQKTAV